MENKIDLDRESIGDIVFDQVHFSYGTRVDVFNALSLSIEKEENVESIVEAAEVIIIKLITNKTRTPKAFPTAIAASPTIPCILAYTPMILKRTIHKLPKKLAQRKLFRVTFGLLIKALSVKTGS